MKTQQGSALIISLLILLVMTMLGVTSMSTSTLEEKMAANDRNQKTALHNSELALSDAEDILTDEHWDNVQQNLNNNTAGYLDLVDDADTQPNYFDKSNWVPNTSCVAQAITDVDSCYVAEFVYDQPPLNPNTTDGLDQGTIGRKFLRITAYATDKSGLSSSMVQSHLDKAHIPLN